MNKTATRSTELPHFGNFPETFRELCMNIYLPKPIHSRTELREASRLVSLLAAEKMNRDQTDFFKAICGYITEYENAHIPKPAPLKPVETIKLLIETHNMKHSDFGQIINASESTVSKILHESRPLQAIEVKMLASHFRMKAEAFL